LNIVEYLFNYNYNLALSQKTKNLRTPCHTAALHGHLDIIKFLLGSLDKLVSDSNNSFCMLNQRDSCGLTPFMDAILGDHLEIVKYLLENYKVFL
jgi:ankyrin repeat protein